MTSTDPAGQLAAPSPQQKAAPDEARPLPPPVDIWGVPLCPLRYGEAVDQVERMIRSGQPGYFITANLQYVMLSNRDPRLADVNRDAAFLLADGMPLVWYSRLRRRRLPERVTGADLIFGLCERAARRGYSAFFLGGAPGVADEAAGKLCQLYPGLKIAGVECPPFREPTPDEHARMIQRIRAAAPDMLFVALGQPKGELWMHENYRALGVPACVQLGATFDFVTGRLPRAPRWAQKLGLEWAYRLSTEPRRLGPRYAANAWFLVKSVLRDATGWLRR